MDRKQFIEELTSNPGVLVLKYGAEWCAPCKAAKPLVDAYAREFPPDWKYLELDADVDFDLYAFLHAKKQVRQIPVLLAYKKGNLTPFADSSITGADPAALRQFFNSL